jgi:polyhydroxyalkanoate synthase
MAIRSIFDPRRSLEQRRQAVANLFDFLVTGGIADTSRTPSDIILEAERGAVRRYRAEGGPEPTGLPVLLVPPLGAPPTCMDLRRGCSLAEHLAAQGHRTYLVDYGEIGFSERDLGLEHWIAELLPNAIRAVSEDAGGAEVALVGWCMGGLFTMLTTAAFPELPIATVVMVASPFDFSTHSILAPLHFVSRITGGRVVNTALRGLGGAPSWMVSNGFKATSLPTYLKKPITLIRHRDDREFLAHIEAVDELMNTMHAYPGRATLQVYERMIRRNELAGGIIHGPNRPVHLADVKVPVMSIAGISDVLVPIESAHHISELVPDAPFVRLETAPGGHLGVLTGRAAPETTWRYIDEHLDSFAAAA